MAKRHSGPARAVHRSGRDRPRRIVTVVCCLALTAALSSAARANPIAGVVALTVGSTGPNASASLPGISNGVFSSAWGSSPSSPVQVNLTTLPTDLPLGGPALGSNTQG
ncbi:MAG: hypothetical protein ACHRXM_40290, partial [Isosphaerales bacterium]